MIATASTKNQELLRELGADETIDYTRQRFEDVARNIDIVLDPVRRRYAGAFVASIEEGRIPFVGRPAAICGQAEALGIQATFVASQPSGAELAKIAELIDASDLKPIVNRILPLSEARRAHGA